MMRLLVLTLCLSAVWGQECIAFSQDAPFHVCDVSIDFDDAASPETATGFESFPIGTQASGSTWGSDAYPGLTFRVVGAGQVFINAADTDLLSKDGIADQSTENDGASFAALGLHPGMWTVDLWSYDSALTTPDAAVYVGPYLGTAATPSINGHTMVGTLTPDATAAFSFDFEALGGDYLFTVVAFNCSGADCNSVINGFSFRAVDDSVPSLTCDAQTLYAVPDASCQATVTWCNTLYLSDECSQPTSVLPTQIGGDSSGDLLTVGGPGTVGPVFSYTNFRGNSTEVTCEYTIADEQGPVFDEQPSDVTIPNVCGSCFGYFLGLNLTLSGTGCNIRQEYSITETGEVINLEPYGNYPFPIGTTNVTVTAIDNIGRTDVRFFLLTVTDEELITVECEAPAHLSLRCGPAYIAWLQSGGFADVRDNCPITVNYTVPPFCGDQPVWVAGQFEYSDGTHVVVPEPGQHTEFSTEDGSCTCAYRLNIVPEESCTEPEWFLIERGGPGYGNVNVTLSVRVIDAAVDFAKATPPYHYHWSNGETTPSITFNSSQADERYSVTVYDSLSRFAYHCFRVSCVVPVATTSEINSFIVRGESKRELTTYFLNHPTSYSAQDVYPAPSVMIANKQDERMPSPPSDGPTVGPVALWRWVTDTENNRVLGFQTLDDNSPDDAATVLGQPDLSADTAGTDPMDLAVMNRPAGLCLDIHGGMYVVDSMLNRVLYFENSTISDPTLGPSAVFAYYGPGTASANLNMPDVSFDQPNGCACDCTGGLYVADSGNNRVLFFPPGANGQPFAQNVAARVYGQPDFESNSPVCLPTAGTLRRPSFVQCDPLNPGAIYVSDTGNNRVLYFPNPKEQAAANPAFDANSFSGFLATKVWGQGAEGTSFITTFATGSNVTTFVAPRGIAIGTNRGSAGALFVAIADNVLQFPAGSFTGFRIFPDYYWKKRSDNQRDVFCPSCGSVFGLEWSSTLGLMLSLPNYGHVFSLNTHTFF